MKITAPKTTEKTTKKLKFNVFNIKSLLVFNRKKLDKVKKENKRFSLFQKKKEKVKQKEEKIESPRTMGSTLKNIAGALLAKPKSIIDKLKEFFGIILLGILVNNLPRIIKELQNVLGKIKEFFDNNPWIGKTIKFAFDIIAKGMMGILDLTKALMPVIGGSFKFALDTIKTTKNEIGKLIKFFDDLGGGIGALMTSFGYKPPAKAAQAYAKSRGKYYSSTTGKTYGSYSQALKNPQVKKGAQQYANQKAQKAIAAPGPASSAYNPKSGTVQATNKKNVVMAPFRGQMGVMTPGDKTGTATTAPKSWNKISNSKSWDPNIQRYQAVNQANKVQKLSVGGTIRNFFGGMFGGNRRGLGNIPPQEGTGRGGPSDTTLTTKDGGRSYAGPYASPAGTAKGRKARETVNYFKIFENNIDLQNRRLKKEENNLSLFSEFMKSYENLFNLRKKYKDTDASLKRTPSGETESPDDYDPGDIGSFASGARIGDPGDTDGEQTGLNMNLPGGIGTPIYAPRDLIYKTRGTKGGPSVGLQGTPDALGPSGSGFGFYGSYFFKDGDKEYEVFMGHFKDMPYKGSKDGEVIPKGTLLGYQGASGRSDPGDGSNDPYPHISLHLNGVGFQASNQKLVEFAHSIKNAKPSASQPGKLIFKGAKATMYNPALGGINASGAKTASGEPATATGEPYRANVFSAAAFPELLRLLPDQYLQRAEGFRGGKTLKRGMNLNLLVVHPQTGKRAIVRLNDVGPGVKGHAANHMLDFSVAAQNYFGAGNLTGLSIYLADSNAKPGPTKAPQSTTKPTPQTKMDAQSVRTNIANLMRELGTNKKIFGQRNLSVEIVDGKLQFKDTRGLFGTGLLQQQYDTEGQNLRLLKEVENFLRYELNNIKEKKDRPGAASSNYGGAKASTNTVFYSQEIAYIVPGPQVPVQGSDNAEIFVIDRGKGTFNSSIGLRNLV